MQVILVRAKASDVAAIDPRAGDRFRTTLRTCAGATAPHGAARTGAWVGRVDDQRDHTGAELCPGRPNLSEHAPASLLAIARAGADPNPDEATDRAAHGDRAPPRRDLRQREHPPGLRRRAAAARRPRIVGGLGHLVAACCRLLRIGPFHRASTRIVAASPQFLEIALPSRSAQPAGFREAERTGLPDALRPCDQAMMVLQCGHAVHQGYRAQVPLEPVSAAGFPWGEDNRQGSGQPDRRVGTRSRGAAFLA